MAHKLLIDFVNEYPTIYGSEFVTYNVQKFIYIPFYVKIHGCLYNFSAFKFKKKFRLDKKKIIISHSRHSFQEVSNTCRIIENFSIVNNNTNNIFIN